MYRRLFLSVAAAAALGAGLLSPAPASAYEAWSADGPSYYHDNHWRERAWREHEWRERQEWAWRRHEWLEHHGWQGRSWQPSSYWYR